jgi:Fe-S-cluster containining protein
MKIDLAPFFKRYEALANSADMVFTNVKAQFPDCVACDNGCSDCCHALFDLTLIEALYINHHFNRIYHGAAKKKMGGKANTADREVYKLKRKAFKDFKSGRPEVEILSDLSMERVRCPFLNSNNRCDFYRFRPITCRLYGIPTSISGISHTCGLSDFKPGESYPTVKLDIIHGQLYSLSAELANAIKSKFSGLSDILVPLSMALLTDYNDDYLGIRNDGDQALQPATGKE